MDLSSALEAVAGFLLVFFLPGYTVTKALFPEWRIRGPDAYLRLLEVVTLGFVLSVVLTILLGYLLLVGAPSGFQAYWSAPVLEGALAAVAVGGFAAGAARGSYARVPPPSRAPPAEPDGEEGAWELTRRLDRLSREERHIERTLRAPTERRSEESALRTRLAEIQAETRELERRREAEYAR